MTPLDAAYEYARRGWPVIPLYGIVRAADGRVMCACPKGPSCPPKSAGKHPRFDRWPDRALIDGPDIFEHFEAHRGDNVGIMTGVEFFGVDLDGAAGPESFGALYAEHGEKPPLPNVRTGSGGLHYWFRLPPGVEIRNSAGLLGEGIDVRGTHGFLVAPPSVSGRGPYTLLYPQLHELPEWLTAKLSKADDIRPAATATAEAVDLTGLPARVVALVAELVPEGQRSERFHAIVSACYDAGLTQGQTVTVVAPWCAAVGKYVGREAEEVARCWPKILADAARLVEWSSPIEGEAEFWTRRPRLTHLHQFARARRVSPWAVLGVHLARVAVMIPFAVHLPAIVGGRGSLNLFVGLVGPSGAGKGAAEAAAADAVEIKRGVWLDVPAPRTVGSGEGIAHAFMVNRKGVVEPREDNAEQHALFSVPEIDALGAQASRRGATTMPELRRAFSGESLGFEYADPTRRVPVPAHRYRLCLIAGIQPKRAGTLLSETEEAGGTPQRFLWMPAIDPDAPETPPDEPPRVKLDLPTSVPSNGRMTVCPLARKEIDEARLARLRGNADALDGHTLYVRLKVAAVLAVDDGRWDVTEDDWSLAGLIVAKSVTVREAVVAELREVAQAAVARRAAAQAFAAETAEERKAEKQLQRATAAIMRRLTDDWQRRKDLRDSLAGRDRAAFDEAVIRLHEVGLIEVQDGRPVQIRRRPQ